MAHDLDVIGSALYARLGTVQYTYVTNGTVTTTGSVNWYDTLAPQNPPTEPPYGIFQMQDAPEDYAFGDGWHAISADYVVKVVSLHNYPIQARQIYATAHDQLQDAGLSVSGYKTMRVRRNSPIEYKDTKGYWHSGGVYRIDVVETA